MLEDYIYELDHDTEEWTNIANIEIDRRYHAISKVNVNEFLDFCKH